MNQTQGTGERLNPVDSIGAAIARAAAVGEEMHVLGQYHWWCMSPPENRRSEAAELQDGIAAASLRRDYRGVERLQAHLDRIPFTEAWRDTFDNTVMTVGKNYMLDNFLAASAFTQTGPYLGLISSVSYTAIAATDTAAQINGTNGWKEAGNAARGPEWSTPAANARGTCAWSAAAAGVKALSAALSFTIATTAGTIKGAFLVLGASAVATNGSTAGTLFSAGLNTGGDRAVNVADVVNATWQLTL